MTLLPIGPWPILAALALALAAVIWWPAGEGVLEEPRGRRWRRTLMVVLLLIAALRPGIPGDYVNASATNLNVYFVVDTTSSMIAEDYGGTHQRLDGVKDDIHKIARELTGARFSLITFDQTARVRMPLSTDALALDASVNTLMPEPNQYSHGSSVTIAGPTVAALLEVAAKKYPDRGRMVFYFGDGEQTAPTPPEPIQVRDGLVEGGAVLGYGTSSGGRMRETRSRYSDTDIRYIKDPSTGQDARSKIDEAALRTIAGHLQVPYVLRSGEDSIAPAMVDVDLSKFGTSEEMEKAKIRNRADLYWWFLLPVIALGAWEAGGALSALSAMRAARGKGTNA